MVPWSVIILMRRRIADPPTRARRAPGPGPWADPWAASGCPKGPSSPPSSATDSPPCRTLRQCSGPATTPPRLALRGRTGDPHGVPVNRRLMRSRTVTVRRSWLPSGAGRRPRRHHPSPARDRREDEGNPRFPAPVRPGRRCRPFRCGHHRRCSPRPAHPRRTPERTRRPGPCWCANRSPSGRRYMFMVVAPCGDKPDRMTSRQVLSRLTFCCAYRSARGVWSGAPQPDGRIPHDLLASVTYGNG